MRYSFNYFRQFKGTQHDFTEWLKIYILKIRYQLWVFYTRIKEKSCIVLLLLYLCVMVIKGSGRSVSGVHLEMH